MSAERPQHLAAEAEIALTSPYTARIRSAATAGSHVEPSSVSTIGSAATIIAIPRGAAKTAIRCRFDRYAARLAATSSRRRESTAKVGVRRIWLTTTLGTVARRNATV